MDRFNFVRSNISISHTKVFIRVLLFVVCLFCANNSKAQYNPYYPVNPYGYYPTNPYGYYPTNPYLDAFRTGAQIGKSISDAITSIVQDDNYDRSFIRKKISEWNELKNGTLSINHGAVAIHGSNGYAHISIDKRLSSKIKEINNDNMDITDVNITDNGYFIIVYDNGTDWYGVIPSSLSTALKKYPNNTVFRSISFNDATGVYAITTSNVFESNNTLYNECFRANAATKGQLLSANICDNGCVFCFSGGVVCCGYIPDNLIPALNKFTNTARFVKFNRHGDYLICAENGASTYLIRDANACGDAQLTFHNVVVNSYNNGIASNNGARQNTTANTPRNNGNMAGQQTNYSAADMFNTAVQYYEAKNYVEAVKWNRKAAEQGLAEAQYNLGVCYANGQGITQSYTEAVKWYRKAAEQGYAMAQYNLGVRYYNGQGITQSYTEAVTWFRKAAEQGNANAQLNLGVCYYDGRGVTQSYTEAVKWYRKAAEQGDAKAQCNLGGCYYDGQGITQSYTEAVKWFRKAAEQGVAMAQYSLGLCYANGQGITQSYTEAVKWYRKAAEQGYANAQCNLGVCYENGRGITQSYTEAVKWYRKAAEQGYASAQLNLGLCYYDGQGITQSYTEAVKWFRKAAEQGVASAQYNLGVSYYKGEGITQSYTEALKWLRKAKEQGHEGATKLVPMVEMSQALEN